eukprot:jgi/Mesen1/5195/ME000258S04290
MAFQPVDRHEDADKISPTHASFSSQYESTTEKQALREESQELSDLLKEGRSRSMPDMSYEDILPTNRDEYDSTGCNKTRVDLRHWLRNRVACWSFPLMFFFSVCALAFAYIFLLKFVYPMIVGGMWKCVPTLGIDLTRAKCSWGNSVRPQTRLEKPLVIMISSDGFRWGFQYKAPTPNIDRLRRTGVEAEHGLIPVFPSVTFPNHYSIATGLLPAAHGITANFFRDPDNATCHFDMLSHDPRWWLGEPIWQTAVDQGLQAATYFWPGSEVAKGNWTCPPGLPLASARCHAQRVDKVLEWVDLPPGAIPSIVTLYFEEPDHAGHAVGSDGRQISAAVARVDAAIGRLLDGLKDSPLASARCHAQRVDKVLEWVDLPPGAIPSIVTLYFEEPDHAGHAVGSDGRQISAAVARVDAAIGRLLDGLKDRGIAEDVDIILLGDHGMVSTCEAREIYLEDFLEWVPSLNRTWVDTLYPLLAIRPPPDVSVKEVFRGLTEGLVSGRIKNSEFLSVYLKDDLPARFNYSGSPRIQPILGLLEEGYSMGFSRSDEVAPPCGGAHGYDNSLVSMRSIFIGRGPNFPQNRQVASFRNVEIYNMMTQILGLQSAPNNGTPGFANQILLLKSSSL